MKVNFLKSQNLHMFCNIDTVQQTLTTKIYFCNISSQGKTRWQETLLPKTRIIAIDTHGVAWDTIGNLLTVIWDKFPIADTIIYSFTVKFTDEIPFSFYWGKGALLFVNTDGNIQKINSYPQCIVKNGLDKYTGLDTLYYIQVGVGSNYRKGDYKLYDSDDIFIKKYNNLYKYQVGPYSSIEQARERLLFYRKQVPDAFIVKEKK